MFLVTIRTEQLWAEARSPTDHLPEFGLGADDFEKHKIDHIGYINARIEHIYGNRDLRIFCSCAEIINQRLGIIDLVINGAGIVAIG